MQGPLWDGLAAFLALTRYLNMLSNKSFLHSLIQTLNIPSYTHQGGVAKQHPLHDECMVSLCEFAAVFLLEIQKYCSTFNLRSIQRCVIGRLFW